MGISRRQMMMTAAAAAGALGLQPGRAEGRTSGRAGTATLFLCGDVMTGRGIDQILPHPTDSRIYEPYMRSARGYVELAERESGPIPDPVDFSYVWGEALEEMRNADAAVVNLETAVTTSGAYAPKGINYRMSPKNVSVLTAAQIDICTLANNHVLDWGEAGLVESLETLDAVGLHSCGAGRDLAEAQEPAILPFAGGRLLVFSVGHPSSGIPPSWGAGDGKPGIDLVMDLSAATAAHIARRVSAMRREGDVVLVSIHWGPNWGYRVPEAERRFAHALIDAAGADLVHGHSSHHPKGVELYRGRPILYGCGDFLNDYEGISGHEAYRPELVLSYLARYAGGSLFALEATPYRIERFRLIRASAEEARWLADTLDRESAKLATRVRLTEGGRLAITARAGAPPP